jgi:hypothetical protein
MLSTVRKFLVLAAVAAALTTGLTGTAQAADSSSAVRQAPAGASAARSVDFNLKNDTNLVLSRAWWNLPHGIWSVLPPETVYPGTWGYWRSESDGFSTGTQGSVTYSTSVGDVYLYWNNPYVGGNSFMCRVPTGYACTAVPGSGGGNNPRPTFYLHRR